jgi:hypothetical protein
MRLMARTSPRVARSPFLRIGQFALVGILTTAGCGTNGSSPASVSSPAPNASEVVPPDLVHAIRQRQTFGLRADLGWVQAVADDPRARIALLDIPLLPEEEAALAGRQPALHSVVAAVTAYAAAVPGEFGGVYIDQAHGVVVALFTGRLAAHRLRIFEELGSLGPLEVRLATYSLRDLEVLQKRVSDTLSWMSNIDAAPRSVWVEVTENVVALEISSANADAARLLLEHYEVPPDMLRIHSDGTGLWLRPRGTILGKVRMANGQPPGPNQLNLRWDGDGPGECGLLDMGFGVLDDGTFELPCTPGGWTIRVEMLLLGADWKEVGRGHVNVPAGATVNLDIVLAP